METISFTKKFSVDSAQVIVHFDKEQSTLTMQSVRVSEKAVADDPSPTAERKINLYAQAALNVIKFIHKWPTQDPKVFEKWEGKICIHANSAKEAFLYWVLLALVPQEYKEDYQHFVKEKQQQNLSPYWRENQAYITAVMAKIEKGKKLTPKEKEIFEKAAQTAHHKKAKVSEEDYRSQVWKDVQNLTFPQLLTDIEKIPTLEDRIRELKVPTTLTDRTRFYEKADRLISPSVGHSE